MAEPLTPETRAQASQCTSKPLTVSLEHNCWGWMVFREEVHVAFGVEHLRISCASVGRIID